VVIATLVVVALALLFFPYATFNYDFGSLQGMSLLSYQLDKQVDHLLGYSQIPVVVLTDAIEEERQVVSSLRQRDVEYGEASRIDFVIASTDLVPENQAAKVPLIRQIGSVLDRIKPKWLERKYRRYLEKVRRMARVEPYSMEDMPIDVHRQLRGPKAKHGSGFVLIFPNISLENGEEIRDLAQQVRSVPIAGGRQVSASGEAMILADILEMVDREAVPVLLITASAVLLTLLLFLGSLRDALFCLVPAALTLLITMGLLPLVGLQVNYLNMIMVPIIFGVGVDGAAHIVTRVRSGVSLARTVDATGRAIAGAILTTTLGFGAMVFAHQPGLKSVGELAALGLAVNLIVCLVMLPAFLAWIEQRAASPQR
jgi:predicted RND superfamily exporter protein